MYRKSQKYQKARKSKKSKKSHLCRNKIKRRYRCVNEVRSAKHIISVPQNTINAANAANAAHIRNNEEAETSKQAPHEK